MHRKRDIFQVILLQFFTSCHDILLTACSDSCSLMGLATEMTQGGNAGLLELEAPYKTQIDTIFPPTSAIGAMRVFQGNA